jgi:hypothetical protein
VPENEEGVIFREEFNLVFNMRIRLGNVEKKLNSRK